jgi:hypothetical protein
MKLKLIALFTSICFVMNTFVSNTVKASALSADIIIIAAKVHTMNDKQPMAEAIAITNNRVVAVGTTSEIQSLVGKQTRVIDAKGKLVLPGFNDSHVHFLSGGFQLSSVDLRDADSPQGFAERIKNFAAKTQKGRWITGGDWDHERWLPANLPTKELIDSFTPDTPVFVNRLDGHMALANSYVLKLAGITKDTKDPEGGLIVRDAKTGEPTGVLKDAAMNYVYRVMPDASFEEKLDAARAATNYAASFGVTSVQDMSAGDDVGVYQTLLERGELKTRIYAVSPLPDWQRWQRAGVRAAFGNAMLRVGGLKGFADGSLGSTTAYFFEPYNDSPDTRGLAGEQMPMMEKNVLNADKAGLQIMIHAIGDRANDEILKIYEKTIATNGERDRRFRIEHAQHIRLQDIKRFGADKVIASMQPYHCIDDGRWAEKRIGQERAKGTYAFRSLLDSGAVLAFGSDWTVAPLNPLFGIYAAVTRRTLDGKNPNGWVPEQKITVEETVRAYTVGSAYAELQEKIKGQIAVGMLADIVMLDKDIFTIKPEDLDKAKVLLTIVDGRVVYERK